MSVCVCCRGSISCCGSLLILLCGPDQGYIMTSLGLRHFGICGPYPPLKNIEIYILFILIVSYDCVGIKTNIFILHGKLLEGLKVYRFSSDLEKNDISLAPRNYSGSRALCLFCRRSSRPLARCLEVYEMGGDGQELL